MAGEKETRAVLAAISLAYPGRFRLDRSQLEQTVELWSGLLSDLREGAALAACRALVASKEHPPSISEIRSQALSVRISEARGAAGNAWAEVSQAFGSHGRDNPPKWSTPAIGITIRAVGGWWHLCTSSNTIADRAKFVDHFTGLFAAAATDVLTGEAATIEDALALRAPASGEAPALVAELGKALKR